MSRQVPNHKFDYCPRCKHPLIPAIALTGESEFWLQCSNPECKTYVCTYIPQEHQRAFHADPHTIKGNFGGYGSGKTTVSRMELEKMILITPRGTTLIGANVTSQYEQTLKREFEADFPVDLYGDVSVQKQYIDFQNGHRVMFRPFDDPGKLRSYNLSGWIILEASEVKEEAFTQLKTRLRNTAAAHQERDARGDPIFDEEGVPVFDADWREGIIESNPAAGWIKTDVLNTSDTIKQFGTVHDNYYQNPLELDPMIASFVTSTDANKYLPKNFIAMQTKNKPQWWIDRYIYGSFLYSDGLVYPSAVKFVCETFPVPRKWKRIVAFDYGLADNACFLFGAIDETNNLLYFYKEIYTKDRNVEELAKLFYKGTEDIPLGGWVCAPIIDPKSGPKRDYNKKTLADNFLDYGISFMPGAVNREARVFRLNTYLESGRVRIMDCCDNLVRQFKELKFKANPTSTTRPWRDEPEDKNDHAVVCAEWIVMELPRDPGKLMYGAYSHTGAMLGLPQDEEEDPNVHAAKRDEEWMLEALGMPAISQESDSYYDSDFSNDGYYHL